MPLTSLKVASSILAATVLLPVVVLADQSPIGGKWEQTIISYMYDGGTKSYKTWAQPKSIRCMKTDDFQRIPLLTPEGSKTAMSQLMGVCEVSDVTTSNNTASWRLQCKEKSFATDARYSVVVSEAEISLISISVNLDNSKGEPFGPDGQKSEMLMRRVGNCD